MKSNDPDRSIPITFGSYIRQLVKTGFSTSVALGAVVCVLFLISGGTTAEIDLTLEFGAFDGFWFLIGLPIIAILISLLLSPLSYGIHRLLRRRRLAQPREDA